MKSLLSTFLHGFELSYSIFTISLKWNPNEKLYTLVFFDISKTCKIWVREKIPKLVHYVLYLMGLMAPISNFFYLMVEESCKSSVMGSFTNLTFVSQSLNSCWKIPEGEDVCQAKCRSIHLGKFFQKYPLCLIAFSAKVK